MRILLYKFYQTLFGYPKCDNPKVGLQFAFSIKDTMNILKESFSSKSTAPIDKYMKQEKKHSLVVKFLNNALDLAFSEYNNPFKSLTYYNTDIIINSSYLINSEKDIIIRLSLYNCVKG